MNALTSDKQNEVLELTIEDMPELKFSDQKAIHSQIEAHLKTIINKHIYKGHEFIRIPSVWILSLFYQQSILDVLDAVYDLKREHYLCELTGLDSPMLVHKPSKSLNDCCFDTPWTCSGKRSSWPSIKRYAR